MEKQTKVMQPFKAEAAIIVNAGDCSDTSSCVSVNITGVKALTGLNQLNVYPNPSTALLNVDFMNPNSEIRNVRIVNMLGDEVYSYNGTDTNLKMDLKDLPKGLYLISVISKQETITMRIPLE